MRHRARNGRRGTCAARSPRILAAALAAGLLAVCGAVPAGASPTYTVTSQSDEELKPSATVCETAAHTCTLRAAIQVADKHGGASTIALPAGDYKLTIESKGANQPENGDLDVDGTGTAITLDGAGAASTLIDANEVDRAFAVQSGESLTIAGVTIRGGASTSTVGHPKGGDSTAPGHGGAIYNAGTLKVEGSVVQESSAPYGGGVYAAAGASSTSVIGTTVSYDTGSIEGGGIDIEGGALTLNGATVVHDISDDDAGGGVYVCNFSIPSSVGAVSITGSTFSADSSDYEAGALYLYKVPSTTISSSTFTDNLPAANGGAIFADEAGPIAVESSTFTGNVSGYGAGGAIVSEKGGLLTVRGSLFEGNTAILGGGSGGAIALVHNDLAVTGSTFRGNDATFGGAISLDGTTATAAESISSSSFYANNATSTGGGAVYDEQGNLSLTSSTFSANTAAKYGGAFYYTGGDGLALTNDTLDGNLASDGGGGIYFQQAVSMGTAVLLNDTVARNTAYNGGGIYAPWYVSTIENTIVALNGGGDCYGAGYEYSADVGGNIDSDGTCFNSHVSSDQVHVNPLLGRLANNGGSTETDALLSGSPAIGHAVKTPAACPSTDERGVSRPSACDSGAYQTPATPTVVSSPPSSSPAGSTSGSASAASSATTTTTTTSASQQCRSMRSETITWRVPQGVTLKRVNVTVDGKPYRTLPGSARTVRVSMVGLDKRTVTVLITGISSSGARYEMTRTFHTCIAGPGSSSKSASKPASAYLQAIGSPVQVPGTPAKATGGSPA